MDQYQVGRPPEKLHQASLNHVLFYSKVFRLVDLFYLLKLVSYLWKAVFGDFLCTSLLQRPFTCPLDDCHSSYRRKDHLTRHLLRHQGKLFKCHVENCNHEFSFQGNMKRHVKELHNEESTSSDIKGRKQYVCQEIGCGKVFKFPSKLRKHEDSHGKLLCSLLYFIFVTPIYGLLFLGV